MFPFHCINQPDYLPRFIASSCHMYLTTSYCCSNTEHRKGSPAKETIVESGISIHIRAHSMSLMCTCCCVFSRITQNFSFFYHRFTFMHLWQILSQVPQWERGVAAEDELLEVVELIFWEDSFLTSVKHTQLFSEQHQEQFFAGHSLPGKELVTLKQAPRHGRTHTDSIDFSKILLEPWLLATWSAPKNQALR